MEEFQVIHKDLLKQRIVCSNCSKQLNVSPIYSVQTDRGIEEICGRCIKIANGYNKTKKWRQYLYEDVAKSLSFPCTNKNFGCTAVLLWQDVLSHEKMCTFSGLKCPFAQKKIFPEATCNWIGYSKEFDQHIQIAHKDSILNPPTIECSDFTENKIFFTNVGTQLIAVLIKFEMEKTYYCLVMTSGNDIESQCYRYQLELFDESKSNSIILRKPRLESLSLILENFNDHDKMLKLDLIKIKELLNNTRLVSGRFGIVRKPKKEIALIKGASQPETLSNGPKPKDHKALDEKLLQELECPVCSYHMIPPIYICRRGHSICNYCITKLAECPNCRDAYGGARNYTLENLTTNVNYPCREQDCPFVATADKILSHQMNCDYILRPCFLECGWTGRRCDMYAHLNRAHPNSLHEANLLQICDIKDNGVFHFIHEHGELFRFCFKQETRDNVTIVVQHIYFSEERPQFRYQFDFVDHSTQGLGMSFTNICQGVNDPHSANPTGISIPWNLLVPFIFEREYFYYKIMIDKI